MSDLWIVLLDSSGSMGQPMSSSYEFSGRLETVNQRIKLSAAKEQLLLELPVLGDSAIAIVSFKDEPALLYSGAASEVDGIRDALVSVTPGGNTNIAAALEEALAVVGTRQPDGFASIFLLSDGLSTVGDPLLAANRCRVAGIRIHTALIDPTEEGTALAHSISQYFYGVRSAAELEEAIAASARDHARSASGGKDAHPLMVVVATFAAILGLSTAIAGFLTSMIEKPTTALPIAGAAVALLASCILGYVFAARKRSGVGFFRSSTDSEPYFPWVPRFPRAMRLWSLATGSLCLILSLALLGISYKNSKTVKTVPECHIPILEPGVR